MCAQTSETCFLDFKWNDESAPKIGDIIQLSYKYPLTKPLCGGFLCCCIQDSNDYWHKIWNGEHWIYQQNLTEDEWLFVIEKYRPIKNK